MNFFRKMFELSDFRSQRYLSMQLEGIALIQADTELLKENTDDTELEINLIKSLEILVEQHKFHMCKRKKV